MTEMVLAFLGGASVPTFRKVVGCRLAVKSWVANLPQSCGVPTVHNFVRSLREDVKFDEQDLVNVEHEGNAVKSSKMTDVKFRA